ncbi:hypothetical protein [Citrobacter braakii]|uniref:hypothetical protein n=1 Tax=Citrobacter braakii TaxID=57706 RepID=UPI00142942D1|nr:hypothetical protein [Salmonella enterica subsp. enterica serovar Newport]MBJ9048924.1 hypothetical protein [Citrobacter braakii]
MLWSVGKSVRLNHCHRYALILNSSYLKMIVEVLTTKQILKSDIIYPVEDALYLINNKKNDTLIVVYATEYSAKKWSALIKTNE